jgi:hypothetical protein
MNIKIVYYEVFLFPDFKELFLKTLVIFLHYANKDLWPKLQDFLLKISCIMKTCFLTDLECSFEYLKTLRFGLNQIEAKIQKL